MLRIITDGAADMPSEWEEKYGIHILPLHINFGEEGYTQGPNFTRADFYRMVAEKRMIPKTSLPSIGQIKAFIRSVAQKGDTILSINISGKLSGTFSTVETAARELTDEFKVIVFDSLAGSVAQGFMAREARQMEQAGAAIADILHRLEVIREQITITFTLDTLEYARLSGRINALQSLFASALNLKPIITLNDGLLEMTDKVRTRQRSLEQVIQNLARLVGSTPMNLAVAHAQDPQTAHKMLQEICSRLNIKESFVTDVSIPIAANLGPGAIGVIAYPFAEEGEK